MKKTGFVFLTMVTVLLSGMLMACSLKKPELNFIENKVVVSLNDSINLDEYLQTKEVSKNEITYNFSNPSLFDVDGGDIIAKASGKSYVYATYQNNSFDSMQIVVKKKFDAPTSFNIKDGVLQSDEGLLTWGAVADYFDAGSLLTTANGYKVVGTYINSENETFSISENRSTNSFQLPDEGTYSLMITANGAGYFDSSFANVTFSYGLIEAPAAISYDSGVVSWSFVEGANYKVKLDDTVLGDYQEETSKDINQYLKNADAGTHYISVISYDKNGDKLPNVSQTLQIEKLTAPTMEYAFSEGGKIKVCGDENSEKFVFLLKNLSTEKETQIALSSVGDDLLTNFENLESGMYSVSVFAKGSKESTYQSSKTETIAGKAAVIYKLPSVSLFEGLGNNEINGDIFKATVKSAEVMFDTDLFIFGAEQKIAGIDAGQTQRNINIEIENSGVYSLNARLLPRVADNENQGEDVFVLSGDESVTLNVEKLEFGGEVIHKYVGNASVFEFDSVENASTYEMKNGQESIQLSAQAIQQASGKTQITLDGKIDDLFDEYNFEIVAKGEDDKLCINASTSKTINVLQAPTKKDRADNSSFKYEWNPSANAAKYRLEIYHTFDNAEYQALLAGNQVSGVVAEAKETSDAEIEVEAEGYYYVKIFALSEDVDNYLSSKEFLADGFYVTEKLALGQVNFGYNENNLEDNPTSEVSAYFIRIANVENAAKFKIVINGEEYEQNADLSTSYTDYKLIKSAIDDEIEISVSALGEDGLIYLDSDSKSLSIKKLQGISYESFNENGGAYVDDATQEVVVKAVQGASAIYIRKDENNKAQGDAENDARFPISAQDSNFELQFEVLGNQTNDDNLYQGEMIYLDAEPATLQFVRYETPTDLEYKDGKIGFVDLTANANNVYVLKIKGEQAGGAPFEIKIEFDNVYTNAIYENEIIPLSYSALYRSISGQNVSINIATIIDFVNEHSTLAAIYANASKISFEVFVHKNSFNVTKGYYELSSANATLKSDSSKSSLTVEKMASAQLEFESETETTYVLKWDAVTVDNEEINNQTSYKIYTTDTDEPIEGTLLAEASGVVSFEFSKTGYAAGEYHNFYIETTNPYYLESNKSNVVRLYKINSLENVKVKSDGTLELMISSTQKDFITKAVVNGEDVVEYDSVQQPTQSTLTVKLVGKTVTNGSVKTYYIDSDLSTWNVAQFATLAPTDTTVDYNENGDLSWYAFAESAGLGSLKYRLLFKDKAGKVVEHDLNERNVNVLTGEIYNKISTGLTAGEISVQIVAYLDTYLAANDSTKPTIYISEAQTTFANALHNAYVYGTIDITKLSTPEIIGVEFESVEFSKYPLFAEETIGFDLQNPDVTISFIGNYGNSAKIMAFVNESDAPAFEGDVAKGSNDEYSFKIDSSYFEFTPDGVMTIKIKVVVPGTIPSALGSVEILRADDLESVEFEKNGDNYTTKLKCVLSSEGDGAIGGIVVKIDYTDDQNNTETLYTLASLTGTNELILDLNQFVADNLSNGGKIKAAAYVNSNSDSANKEYYLPSQNAVDTGDDIDVLKMVKADDIVRQAGGFTITSTNGETCTFAIEYGGNEFEVTSQNGFYFEFPNDWTNGTYNLVISAKEAGKMTSIKSTHSFTLSRLDSVDKASVALTRSSADLSQTTISWSAVDGATSYLFRIFDKEDEVLIFEKNLATVTHKTSELFGENFSEMSVENPIDYFKEDKNLRLEIIANGNVTTSNSSKITSIDLVLKGNALLGAVDAAEILTIDELGRLHFAANEGQNYLYKYLADDVAEQKWQEIEGVEETIFDTNEFSKLVSNLYFNMKISRKGDESNFELDSYVWSTKDVGLTLKFNTAIVSMGYNENLASGIALEILNDGFENIYAGLSEDALLNGQVATLRFAVTEVSPSNNINKIYNCGFSEMLDMFAESGITFPVSANDVNVYVWAQSTDEVASMPYLFTFVLNQETDFEEIRKNGETSDPGTGETLSHDYANVYAIFANNDVAGIADTRGIYVKIENDQFEKPIVKFITKDQLVSDDFEGKFIINLTSLFEESDLINLVGDFEISFARLQIQDGIKFVISDWVNDDGVNDFVFTRLAPASAVSLLEGNVYWNGYDGGKYYVYFANDINQETLELGDVFTIDHTELSNVDASKYVGLDGGCYIAVQVYGGDSEDVNKFVLPSRRVFVSEFKDSKIQPIKIYKNQVSSPIVLKDGQLRIEWPSNSEILKVLTQLNPDSSGLVTDEPFKSPFTFTLADLLDGKLFFRLKFESVGSVVGVEKTFDVNAKDLMADLFAENELLKAALEKIHGNEQSDLTVKERLKQFLDYCNNSCHGIGNARKLFDEIFENLQVGSYSMRYCLLGTERTLTSVWYDFENENAENIVHVNAQPKIFTKKEPTKNDKTKNVYKLIIKKSMIKTYDSSAGEYVDTLAENYVMRLVAGDTRHIFDITKGINNYSLKLRDSEIETSVSVYTADEEGTIDAAGEYLMLFINHNEGNSLLGVYGENILKNTYEMQIFAVGNDYSLSSKSQHHSLTFLSFGTGISVVDGEILWVPHLNRATTVVYKRLNYAPDDDVVTISSDLYYSRFSLNSGEGHYEYLKMLVVGETRTNSTFIDSEVYTFNDVYKLGTPTTDEAQTAKTVLSNKLGYLSIDLGNANKARLDNSYSETNLYNYRIYNDASNYNWNRASTYISIADERSEGAGVETLYYQPGITGVDSSSEGYAYKNTENRATSFSVALMGSTVTNIAYTVEQEAANADDYNAKYYERTFKLVDTDGVSLIDFSFALRSNFETIDAQMMSDMGELSIENSVLKWEGNKSASVDENYNVNTPVYKVIVTLYENTSVGSAESQQTQTSTSKELVYYTAKTEFDFAKIEADLVENSTDSTFIKASVQALALNISQISHSGCVELVEGGYAYGNVNYTNADLTSSSTKVLMSNGSYIDGITRFESVENLTVEAGKLTWTFEAEPSLSQTAFREKYDFEVVQVVEKEQKTISGVYTISETEGTYKIVFKEDIGQMLEGVGTFKVYVKQGSERGGKFIKSFATAVDGVTKLSKIKGEDFEILSDLESEILDFSLYFAKTENVNNTVVLKANVNGEEHSEIKFTKNNFKMHIFRETPQGSIEYSDDFVKTYLTIANNSVARLTFVVKKDSAKVIYSDTSEEFVLQRSSWGDGAEIVWDETEQIFSWNYDYNTFHSDESLQKLTAIYVANKTASVYLDEGLSVESEISLASGDVVTVEQIAQDVAKLNMAGVECYVASENIDLVYKNVAKTTIETTLYSDGELSLPAKDENEQDVLIEQGVEIAILQTFERCSKIAYQGKAYYLANESIELVIEEFSAGQLFKIVDETSAELFVENEAGDLFKVALSEVEISRPEFAIEAKYGTGENTIVRTYTTQGNVFQPTIVGDVTISITIKLGTTNVESQRLVFDSNGDGIEDYVSFNLFESGSGTAALPYQISTLEQFKNISYRMTKANYLKTYYQKDGDMISGDGEKYYFELADNLSFVGDDAFDGILLKGEFDGVLNGNNYTIEYLSNNARALTNTITVSEGNVLGATAIEGSTTFDRGAALFEEISSISRIENLNIKAKFGVGAIAVTNHALVAGLVIKNEGTLNNITILEYSTNLYGDAGSSRRVMAYGGIVGINYGSSAQISNCKILSSVQINDLSENQLIFIGGIAYANLSGGMIEQCVAGNEAKDFGITVICEATNDTIQIAGIVVTNSSTSRLTANINHLKLTASSNRSETFTSAYLGGIACYGKGTTIDNTSTAIKQNGDISTFNISSPIVGDLFAIS